MKTEITRRQFITYSAKLAALMGLGTSAVSQIAEAIEQIGSAAAPVLWLQGQSCSGCSVSLLNSVEPGPAEILTSYLSLRFHSTLSVATGETGMEVIRHTISKGGYILVVEGSIPQGMPSACQMGEEPITHIVSNAAKNAKSIIAVGACASFGGIPAAENNPTGACSVPEFLKNEGIHHTVIILPGCPAHPDWIVGTLIYLLKFGIPPLDDKNRPLMFFSRLVHDQCPRFADYEREYFAKDFSERGCLFKLGCLGPNTHADCTVRYWNAKTNSCILAGAPCIGCASEDFAKKAAFPFYRRSETFIEKEG